MKIFINLSNHPSEKWSIKQQLKAEEYGKVVDLPFPDISPELSKEEISMLADDYTEQVLKFDIGAVMVQGEFTFSYALIRRLKKHGVVVLAACSERKTEEEHMPDGSVIKNSIFEFCGFREYE